MTSLKCKESLPTVESPQRSACHWNEIGECNLHLPTNLNLADGKRGRMINLVNTGSKNAPGFHIGISPVRFLLQMVVSYHDGSTLPQWRAAGVSLQVQINVEGRGGGIEPQYPTLVPGHDAVWHLKLDLYKLLSKSFYFLQSLGIESGCPSEPFDLILY